MSDHRDPESTERPRRDHLRLVTEAAEAGAVDPGAITPGVPRARSIGRLIAQTAQLAESATNRRREVEESRPPRGSVGERLLRRLR